MRRPLVTARAKAQLASSVGLLVSSAGVALAACGQSGPAKVATRASVAAGPARSAVFTTRLGSSVDGRPITATARGDARARASVLVVGCIHGNESAGIAIVRRLASLPAPRGVRMWLLPDLNPDGVHAGTRQNARGVDLNRNFPFAWRPLGARGDQQYSGSAPLSEPESQIAHRLIVRVRPRVTIWFHQPLGVVDESGGEIKIERRFARLANLPLRRLARYPGSAVGWQDDRLPGTTAFVVELPAGRLSRARVQQLATAVIRLARSL
jgi:protein MpaA